MAFTGALMITHAPRWEIQESSLGIPHEEVRIGDGQSAWYVPSKNGAAVMFSHGSGGSRERVVAHIRMLARHGYGVLALDNPGNGESDGHSNGLGDNAQPGIDAALGWLAGRPDVDPRRIAAVGTSLGGEVLLEAAARDPRIRAVVSDGAARPQDAADATDMGAVEKAAQWLQMKTVRGVSGTRSAPSLFSLMPRIAPRPALLVASGRSPARRPRTGATRPKAATTSSCGLSPAPGTRPACARTRPSTSGASRRSSTRRWRGFAAR